MKARIWWVRLSLGLGRFLDPHSAWWSRRRFVSRPGHCIDRFGGDASGYTACDDLPNARRIPPRASILSPGGSDVSHCRWYFGSAVLAESSSVGPSATATAECWRVHPGVSAVSTNRLHPASSNACATSIRADYCLAELRCKAELGSCFWIRNTVALARSRLLLG